MQRVSYWHSLCWRNKTRFQLPWCSVPNSYQFPPFRSYRNKYGGGKIGVYKTRLNYKKATELLVTATGLEPQPLSSQRNTQPFSQTGHLAKWLSVVLWTKWLWVLVQLQLLKLQISRLLRARGSLTLRQLQSVDSIWNAYVTWQEHTVKVTEIWNKSVWNKICWVDCF